MAMLASKSSYPAPLGILSSGHTPSAGQQYSAGISTHKVPAMTTSHNGTFASPTESEFSDAFEGPDPVR
jgi:mitogen-activated protein kinase kinase kinase